VDETIDRCAGMNAFNEYDALSIVATRSPRAAFAGTDRIAREWRDLNFSDAPDLMQAIAQHDVLVAALTDAGARVIDLPTADGLTLDAVYVRDASVVTPKGSVLCRMGKPARAGEPDVQGRALTAAGHAVLGAIEPPGKLEGGDVVWFDQRTVAVGCGYRTNSNGIEQLRGLLGPGIDLVTVPLPHYRGPADVFHLMSILSPVDKDLAVVYSPLMPVPFREWLMARDIALVEVPDAEFESMAANVLALSPRRCLMLEGLPETRTRLEAAGADVLTYDGSDISVKGGGGPTCLTRPLARTGLIAPL
jgi:N-dimethylarginine dimethylaminohydrolase